MFSLEYELELRRRSAVNFARLLDCLERVVGREVPHIYDWPAICESFYLDMCQHAGTYSTICRNQLTAPVAVRRECERHFSECMREAYGE